MWSRLLTDMMTLSLEEEGYRSCSGHRGWFELVFVDRSGLVRVEENVHVGFHLLMDIR